MSKERLEEIKEWYEFNHDKSVWKVVSIRRKDFKWLIEQVQESEEQNKRYRELLIEIEEGTNHDELAKRIRQALEGSE